MTTQSDEQAIRDVVDRYIAAVRANDADAMKSLYADDVHVFDSFGKWDYRGDAWRDNADAWLGQANHSQDCEFDNLHITVAGDLATFHADVRYSGEFDGERHSMWNRMTSVLRNIDGSWKVTHEHTSVFLDSQTNEPVFERDAEAS